MKAMVLSKIVNLSDHSQPLEMQEIPKPETKEGEVLIKVAVCGVCHTELDEIEGRTPPPSFPVVLGHQVVGKVEKVGEKVTKVKIGDRVGVAWIFSGEMSILPF